MPTSKIAYTSLIQETLSELQKLESNQKKSFYKDRVRFIRYLKEGTAKSQPKAGALIGLQERQSQHLWKLYRQRGMEGLLKEKKVTHLGKLSSVEYSRLLQRLDQDDMMSQKQLRAYLQNQMGKEYTQAGVHYLFKRLKVKLKTGRPVNVRKDHAGEEAFKKMPDLTQSYGKEQIYFTDEMRYGMNLQQKTGQKIKLLFDVDLILLHIHWV
jgi:transposase